MPILLSDLPLFPLFVLLLDLCWPFFFRMFSPDWAHDHNNARFGTNNSCGTMDHSTSVGGDEACLGGLSQHGRYGFGPSGDTDMAYTSSSYVKYILTSY